MLGGVYYDILLANCNLQGAYLPLSPFALRGNIGIIIIFISVPGSLIISTGDRFDTWQQPEIRGTTFNV